jgi:hypothetical protein
VVLYLSKDVVNESVSGEQVIDAIDGRKGVIITYSGEDNEHYGPRYIEPYVYGVTSKGNPAIRAYQYYGDTKKGVPKWKLFRLDRVNSWEVTDETFDTEPKERGWNANTFNSNDLKLPVIYKTVELGEKPVTDLERMKARTRQLQKGKPVNINQLQSTPQVKKQTGPIVQNQQANQEPIQKQDSNPLNRDGSEKQYGSEPPVKQPPKQEGPIVEPEKQPEKTDNEPFDNKEFQDMLRRNLDITRKEKENRGFNLGN